MVEGILDECVVQLANGRKPQPSGATRGGHLQTVGNTDSMGARKWSHGEGVHAIEPLGSSKSEGDEGARRVLLDLVFDGAVTTERSDLQRAVETHGRPATGP